MLQHQQAMEEPCAQLACQPWEAERREKLELREEAWTWYVAGICGEGKSTKGTVFTWEGKGTGKGTGFEGHGQRERRGKEGGRGRAEEIP